MQINFLGDSITQGACATSPDNMYTALVCKHFGAKENNFGIGGTRIAKQFDSDDLYGEYFLLRAVKMPTDVAFTIAFGGTNDFGHGDAPLGKRGDTTDDTFYGAFENLVTYLLGKFPREKLLFVLPLPRNNQFDPRGDGQKQPIGTLSDYVDIEVEILRRHNVDYLDLSNVLTYEQSLKTELFQDGLHPNDKGHKILAEQIIKHIQDKI